VHCHGGQAGIVDEDLAHSGVIANPLQANAAVCQTCHCDDCQAHVDEFLAVAGGTVIEGQGRVFPTPAPEPSARPPVSLPTYRLPESLHQPWRVAGLTLAGVMLVGLSLFGLATYWSERHHIATS
jgi:hypothetical protein